MGMLRIVIGDGDGKWEGWRRGGGRREMME